MVRETEWKYDPAAGLPAGPASKPRLTRHSPAGEVVLAYLHDQAAAISHYGPLVLLDDLDALLADPPLTPLAERESGKKVADPVRRAARRLQHVLDAVPGAEDRDTAIHQARKATKRARYAAEAAVPALGSTTRRQAAQARELQQLLGDHHDSVVARAVLLELAQQARTAGEDTFTYGLMYQRQACQAAEIEPA